MTYGNAICGPIADELVTSLCHSRNADRVPRSLPDTTAGKTYLGSARRWARVRIGGETCLVAVLVQLFECPEGLCTK